MALAALLTIAAAVAVIALRTVGHARGAERRAEAIEASAPRLLVDLLGAESGQRGYLISGHRNDLRAYRSGAEAAPVELSRLTVLGGRDRELARDMYALRSLTDVKLLELAHAARLQATGLNRRALAIVRAGEGSRTMDLLRAEVGTVLRKAGVMHASAHRAASHATAVAVIVDALMVVLVLALGWHWRTTSARALEQRRLATHALRDAQRETRLERGLREVAAASAGGIEPAELFDLVAGRVLELLDAASGAAVVRFDSDRGTIVGARSAVEMPRTVPLDESSVSGAIARTGRPARIDDYARAHCPLPEFATERGWRSAVAVPLRIEGRLWGSLGAVCDRPQGLAIDAEEVLGRFAVLVSASLANAEAQQRLRFRARLEEALREVAVASASNELDERGLGALVSARVAGLLNAPSAALVRFDADGLTTLGDGGPVHIPAATALTEASAAAQVARHGKTVIIEDCAQPDGRSREPGQEFSGAVAAPVFVGGKLWGSLGARSPREGFPADAPTLLERFAQLISAALANTQAQARLREEARVERALREVSAASAGGEHDAHALFDLVAKRIADLLHAEAGMVVRLDGGASVVVGVHSDLALPQGAPPSVTEAVMLAVKAGRAARIDDNTQVSPGAVNRHTATASELRTVVVAPVRLRETLWGCIAVADRRPHSLPPRTEFVLERFASLVSVALAQVDTLATLQQQATTDGLTGLLNHRAFQQRLDEELRRAVRHHRSLALCMFDLDAFKEVNDTHGHQAGDRVLQAVAGTLTEHKRAGDIPARVGGDEFAVIAPDTSAEDALALAERLRQAAANAIAQLGQVVTVSAGVTDLSMANTIPGLVHLADSALYQAKHHGRNTAVRYTPGAEHDLPKERQQRSERSRVLTALSALARAVDTNAATDEHAERVASISSELATHLGWNAERCARLREAALLHDIGKIGVPDAILAKPGKLTPEEYEQVKTHPLLGSQIAHGVLDEEQVHWVRLHHERPDGRGYPDALNAQDIPDGALLLGVADAFDAITSPRSYRTALTARDAIREMRSHGGTQFDQAMARPAGAMGAGRRERRQGSPESAAAGQTSTAIEHRRA